MSHRYFLNFFVLLLPLCAIGIVTIRWKALQMALLIAAMGMVPMYKREEGAEYKSAALILKDINSDKSPRMKYIICTDSAVPLYAEAQYARYNGGALPQGDCLVLDADWMVGKRVIEDNNSFRKSFRLEAVSGSVQVWTRAK